MQSTDRGRRQFLTGALAVAGAAAAGSALLRALGLEPTPDAAPASVAAQAVGAAPTSTTTRTLVLSPQARLFGHTFALGVLELSSRRVQTIATPMLGHSVVGHPTEPDRVVVLGQRPDKRSCVVSLSAGAMATSFEASRGRHFYGHGAFSPDGRVLYTTENDDHSGLGYVVARDARTLAPLGELSSHGMAPHELAFDASGTTAIIANGGAVSLEDDYDDGEHAPSALCYVEVGSGKLLERLTLPDPLLSIRHLTLGARGEVVVALKRYPETEPCPTIALHRPGQALTLTQPDAATMARMGSLALSVVVDRGGSVVGATHPNSGAVSFWDLRDGRHLGLTRVEAPEGIVALPSGEFLVTSQRGTLTLFTLPMLPAVEAQVGRTLPIAPALNWKHALLWQAPATA